ncbi:hypothetical protein BT96DRAFT_935682 [Gymnopus androsaceus JB14]|uniref:Uncharacterized protein n=1 Tax=Gymnopus androsaceus JB14 TaxID=1447944 RepID=A0A6A4I214_9AGAR|nr:hypothetical protein BT96DRAFT_935682 [Gymnopus androsaceus JB14]
MVQQYDTRIQHPQPYILYATAQLVTIGEDATIAGQFDLHTQFILPVTGNPAPNAMHSGVVPQPLVHPPGVAQQLPVHTGHMQYAYPVQGPQGPPQDPNYAYPNLYDPLLAPPSHTAYNYTPYADESKVKLFLSIMSAFTSTIDNDTALRNQQNWLHWHDAVLQALVDGGVISHICDEPLPGAERTEYNTPLYCPHLSLNPHPAEIEVH